MNYYLLKNIQRAEYKKKFKTFIFKIAFLIKKINYFNNENYSHYNNIYKFIISISFIKIKVEVDVKNFIYYNYNQVEHIKRDCF